MHGAILTRNWTQSVAEGQHSARLPHGMPIENPSKTLVRGVPRKPASAATAADFRAVSGYTRPQEYTTWYAHHNLNWPALHKCTSQLSN